VREVCDAEPASSKVFLALEPCGMRKSLNELYAVTQHRLGEVPRKGGCFCSPTSGATA